MINLILTILMLAGTGLLVGGVIMLRKTGNRKQAVLMFIASAVMFLNVGIWTIPTDTGNSPVETMNAERP